jgi:hypothetical protein
MKRFFLGIAFCLICLGAAEDIALPDNAYLQGAVSYILEDYSSAETTRRLVKAHPDNNKTHTIITLPPRAKSANENCSSKAVSSPLL